MGEQTKGFHVEMHGNVREVYYVEAETAEASAAHWMDGYLINSEVDGMDFYRVEEVDDND